MVDDGVLSSGIAPAGVPPEGGGTGPNKLFPELEPDNVAGAVV